MKRFYLTGMLLIFLAGAGFCSSPYQMMNLQGRLTDIGGTARAAGPYSMTFSIYDSIGVGADPEMTPRELLVTVPLAVTARYVKGGSVEAFGNPAVAGKYSDKTYGYVGYKYREGATWRYRGLYGYSSEEGTGGWGIEAFGAIGGVIGWSGEGAGVYGRTSSVSPAVWGYNINTAGGGPGVKGESESGYGVYGTTNANKPAIYGENPNFGAGVKGWSKGGVGVAGQSEENVALFGSSSREGYTDPYFSEIPVGATVGWALGSLVGVHGVSKKNYGVFGSSEAEVGVYGFGKKGGVRGESSADHGVWGLTKGTNKAGVMGLSNKTSPRANVDAGVYGESLSGYGVEGVSNAAGKAGVVGLGNLNFRSLSVRAGVYGESAGGYGVYGVSRASDKAGIYASSEAGGIALEIGKGCFKVKKLVKDLTLSDGQVYPQTMNEVMGIFSVTAASGTPSGRYATIPVTNPNFTTNSIIIIADDSDDEFWISDRSTGTFVIHCNLNTTAKKFKFMIIN